jgi:hydroxylaminobenzene mutase
MDLLVQIGLIELAVGGLLGWAVVMRSEKPELFQRIGLKQPRAVLQIHLDYILMGLILIALGLVLDDPPPLLAGLLIFGTVVNPLLFLPGAFDKSNEKKPVYRAIAIASFLAISVGLVWAAILGPS